MEVVKAPSRLSGNCYPYELLQLRWMYNSGSDIPKYATNLSNWRPTSLTSKTLIYFTHGFDKILYKFIIDGVWVVDPAKPTEKDDQGNTNNVFYVRYLECHVCYKSTVTFDLCIVCCIEQVCKSCLERYIKSRLRSSSPVLCMQLGCENIIYWKGMFPHIQVHVRPKRMSYRFVYDNSSTEAHKTSLTILSTTRECIKCKVRITKNGGCMTITCPICNQKQHWGDMTEGCTMYQRRQWKFLAFIKNVKCYFRNTLRKSILHL